MIEPITLTNWYISRHVEFLQGRIIEGKLSSNPLSPRHYYTPNPLFALKLLGDEQ
jgi:hypothetical protein